MSSRIAGLDAAGFMPLPGESEADFIKRSEGILACHRDFEEMLEVQGKLTVFDFVEVKKSKINSNTNAGHLSYIGDSEIGSHVNIGAGTITANYNPLTKVKSKTILEDNVKIGSNAVLVAPVVIEEGANIGAGGVITKNVKSWALAITRAPLRVLENWVKKN